MFVEHAGVVLSLFNDERREGWWSSSREGHCCSVLLISLQCVTRVTVQVCETAETSPPAPVSWARPPRGGSRPESESGLGGPPPGRTRWPRPTLLSDPFLGQLVLASGGGMCRLGSTRQGLFTMADDLEQQ